MPLSLAEIQYAHNPPSMTQEVGSVAKRAIYTTAVATAASFILGGESFSQSSDFLGMQIPNPLVAGLSIGLGAAAGKALNDVVAPKVFPNLSSDIKTAETIALEGGLAVAGGLAGMKYLAGVDPNVTNAILSGGSYVGGSWLHMQADPVLLGKLW